MSDYLDIFVRDTLGQSNSLPRTGGGSQSPDIIPAGTKPVANPDTQFGPKTYDQNVASTVVYGQENYIYVRGKNYGKKLAVGTVSLYAAYQTQLSNPSAWTQLSTTGGSNSSAAAAETHGVAVSSDPFIWAPDEPSGDNPYVLIAVIATQDNSDPVPAYKKDPEEFEKWQSNLGGVAALSVAVPTPPKPKPTYAFSALVNLSNAESANVGFNLGWTGGVKGDLISLTAEVPGGPTIGFEDFAVTSSSQETTARGSIPANYMGVVQYQYKTKDEANLPAPTLTLTVVLITKSDSGGGGFGPNGGGTETQTQVAEYKFTSSLTPT